MVLSKNPTVDSEESCRAISMAVAMLSNRTDSDLDAELHKELSERYI